MGRGSSGNVIAGRLTVVMKYSRLENLGDSIVTLNPVGESILKLSVSCVISIFIQFCTKKVEASKDLHFG